MDPCDVLVVDGRGERASHLAARFAGGALEVLAAQALPHSLGLLYEELTAHLGFRRSSDEYKVMAMASYGEPSSLEELRELVRTDGRGGFAVGTVDLARLAPPLSPGEPFTRSHADLAASVQRRLEEVLVELARWLHGRTGTRDLVMAGGVALNCVANSRLWREGPYERIWVQPAAGDAGGVQAGARPAREPPRGRRGQRGLRAAPAAGLRAARAAGGTGHRAQLAVRLVAYRALGVGDLLPPCRPCAGSRAPSRTTSACSPLPERSPASPRSPARSTRWSTSRRSPRCRRRSTAPTSP